MSTVTLTHIEEHHDPFGARFGMWLFLFTELLLFGGVFLLYAVYRSAFPEDFHYGATTLHTLVGGINTLILLTSSLTMVLAIAKLERGRRAGSALFLAVTILLGLSFLVIKAFEWGEKISHGIFPGSEVIVEHTPGENIFYGLYYGMTGLHALHVVIGLGVLGWMLVRLMRPPRRTWRLAAPAEGTLSLNSADGRTMWTGRSASEVSEVAVTMTYRHDPESDEREKVRLENAGLYWHLVDVIWIFLFPLLYLIT